MDQTPTTQDPALGRLLLHSTLAFVVGFLLSTILHEGAHALTARVLGLHPVLHHNYVSTPDADSALAAWAVPAAGPLMSLVSGIVAVGLARLPARRSVWTLVALWLGVHGLIGFFGYVMLGAFVPYGDTGRIWAIVGMPEAVRWVLAVAALGALIVAVRGLAPDFADHGIPLEPGPRRAEVRIANRVVAWPIVIGAVVVTLLALPVPTVASLMHPLTSPFVVFAAYGRMRRTSASPGRADYPDGPSWPLLAVSLGVVALFRQLVPGIAL